MDALEEQAWQAPVFRKSNLLYLYCVDLEHVSELTIPSLPFLNLKCLFWHVSFPRTLSERRMVVSPQCNRLLEKLKDVTLPCVIKVVSSVIFQIHPDEIEDDSDVMLIWDFEVTDLSLTASYCSVKAKKPSSVSSIDSFMPPLDLGRVTCNCADSSSNEMVLLSCTDSRTICEIQRLSLSDIDEENACEEEEEDKEEEQGEGEDDDDFPDASGLTSKELFAPESTTDCPPTEPLYTETFTLKGSSFHEHFQTTLKSCKEKMINKETILIRLGFEPVNRRDENAVLVHVCPGDTWEPIR